LQGEQINITLGTAGHIDHGKTALVKLLTGCDTDRLKEEKERGMSIELGFAPCKIADVEAGIVDVPGHEHFIKTMVAGATGIDAVILVIAADDGIMPQTREHLDILTLLGVRYGVVALTKIDRVDKEHIALVEEEIEELVRGTFLEGAAILPISNITGEGFDGFYEGLTRLVKSVVPKGTEGVFRLPVERSFSVKGFGTVVTGIAVAGAVKTGDEVVLLPQGMSGRVNSIQVYTRDGDAARAGQCAAINVRHWEHDLIGRGDVLAAPGYFAGEQWYVCRMRLLPKDTAALKNGARIKFHTGTSEVPATVYLFEGEKMMPGGYKIVQVRLDSAVVAGPTDKFIVRTLSPVTTIGGGMIVEAVERKLNRKTAGMMEDLRERAEAVVEDKRFVEYAVKTAEVLSTTGAEIARRCKVTDARLRAIIAELSSEGRIRALGAGLYIHNEVAEREKRRILAALAEFHARSPEAAGVGGEALGEELRVARAVFDGLLDELAKAGAITNAGGRLAVAGHSSQIKEADRGLVGKVEAAFRRRLFDPPSVEEAAVETGLAKGEAERGIRILAESGALVSVAPGMWFHREGIETARARIVAFIEKEGELQSVKFKYLIDTTRKYAIPLLDYFDKVGVTRRVANTRYLKGK